MKKKIIKAILHISRLSITINLIGGTNRNTDCFWIFSRSSIGRYFLRIASLLSYFLVHSVFYDGKTYIPKRALKLNHSKQCTIIASTLLQHRTPRVFQKKKKQKGGGVSVWMETEHFSLIREELRGVCIFSWGQVRLNGGCTLLPATIILAKHSSRHSNGSWL